jgi:hypothetical protein
MATTELPGRRVDGSPYDPAKVGERDAESAGWTGGDGVPRYASPSAAEEAFPGWAGSSADYWSRLGPAGQRMTSREYSAAYREAQRAGTLPPPAIPARLRQAATDLDREAGE